MNMIDLCFASIQNNLQQSHLYTKNVRERNERKNECVKVRTYSRMFTKNTLKRFGKIKHRQQAPRTDTTMLYNA